VGWVGSECLEERVFRSFFHESPLSFLRGKSLMKAKSVFFFITMRFSQRQTDRTTRFHLS